MEVLNKRENYATIKFSEGGSCLISIAGKPHPSIKITKVVFGFLPTVALWELDSKRIGGYEKYVSLIKVRLGLKSEVMESPLDGFIRMASTEVSLSAFISKLQSSFNG